MTLSSQFQQYKQQSINTMAPGELISMLYDGLIKNLKRTIIFIDKNDHENAKLYLNKSKAIVDYLLESLDLNFEISFELKRLYRFFNQQIINAGVSYEKKYIEDIIPLIEDLGSTWRQAEKLSRKK